MEEEDFGDQLDRSFEVSLEEVKAKAIKGIGVIMGRGFILNFIAQISQFFLLAFLDVDQLGVFWIVSAAVGFLIYFSDIGLAAALIQKKEKPTETDLKTTFTVQQSLVVILLIVLFLLSPTLRNIYHLSDEGMFLLYALGVSLFFSSLKSIPSVLLERQLEFAKFIIPDIIESLIYSVSVVFFAWQGFGIRSFTYAVLLRGIFGVVTIYIIRPWKPGFAFSKESLKHLFKFGVPYQINSLIAVVKDRGLTLALGAVIGTSGVGYLGTAERLSQMPLRLFMDPTTKVTFPAFSRMQEHKKDLENSVTRSILFITFLVFPFIVGLWLTAPVLIKVIPKYEKWEPALLPLGFMSINVLFASVTTQLTNMLMAIGKIKVVTKLIIMWTVLTLILVPGLGAMYGFVGASIGYSLVGSSSIVAIYVAKKHVNFSLKDGVFKTGFATICMAIVVITVRVLVQNNMLSLILMIGLGGAVYAGISYYLIGADLAVYVKKISKALLNRS